MIDHRSPQPRFGSGITGNHVPQFACTLHTINTTEDGPDPARDVGLVHRAKQLPERAALVGLPHGSLPLLGSRERLLCRSQVAQALGEGAAVTLVYGPQRVLVTLQPAFELPWIDAPVGVDHLSSRAGSDCVLEHIQALWRRLQ